MEERRPFCWEVLTGSSRRLQPRELIESRKVFEAMAAGTRGAGSTGDGGRNGYVDRAAAGS